MRILVTTSRFNPKIHSKRIGGWNYEENHKAYVWGGEAMRPAEANAVFDSKAFRDEITEHGQFLRIQCVEIRDMKAARAALEKMRNESASATA